MNSLKAARAKVNKYVADVLAGRAVVGKWERLACKRYRADKANGRARGIKFDVDKAMRAVKFIELLKHSKGEWAGTRFILAPWQLFIVWNLFGWVNRDGFRRFRTGYFETARKNGKTTLIAAIGLYLFVADDEPGAEVYSSATKRDQAIISHSEATRMVRTASSKGRRLSG